MKKEKSWSARNQQKRQLKIRILTCIRVTSVMQLLCKRDLVSEAHTPSQQSFCSPLVCLCLLRISCSVIVHNYSSSFSLRDDLTEKCQGCIFCSEYISLIVPFHMLTSKGILVNI